MSSTGTRNILIGSNTSSNHQQSPRPQSQKEHYFATITNNIPAYPGCEGLTTDERMTCNSVKFGELVNKRYDFAFDAVKFLNIKE